MYDVPNKDTMKYEIPPHLFGQNPVRCQKEVGWKLFHAVSTNLKPLVDGRLLLRFHDAVPIVRGSMPCNRSRWRS